MTTSLYKQLNKAINSSCPTLPIQTHQHKPNHWYNKEIKEESKRAQKAYKKAQTSNAIRDTEHYKKLKKEYKKSCKTARKKSWQKFKSDAQSIDEMTFLAKLAQRTEKHTIHTLDTDNGTTTPGSDTIQALVETFFPDAERDDHIKYYSVLRVRTDVISQSYNDWINPLIIQAAIKIYISLRRHLVPITFLRTFSHTYQPMSFHTSRYFIKPVSHYITHRYSGKTHGLFLYQNLANQPIEYPNPFDQYLSQIICLRRWKGWSSGEWKTNWRTSLYMIISMDSSHIKEQKRHFPM